MKESPFADLFRSAHSTIVKRKAPSKLEKNQNHAIVIRELLARVITLDGRNRAIVCQTKILGSAFGRSLNGIFADFHFADLFRAAPLQNETAPEKILNRYEKWFEKREKGSEKRSETRLKNC